MIIIANDNKSCELKNERATVFIVVVAAATTASNGMEKRNINDPKYTN